MGDTMWLSRRRALRDRIILFCIILKNGEIIFHAKNLWQIILTLSILDAEVSSFTMQRWVYINFILIIAGCSIRMSIKPDDFHKIELREAVAKPRG